MQSGSIKHFVPLSRVCRSKHHATPRFPLPCLRTVFTFTSLNHSTCGRGTESYFLASSPENPNTNFLTPCQSELLVCLLFVENETASGLATEFCERTRVAASTYWYSVRALRKNGLVTYGSGEPVKLTERGKNHAKALQKETITNENKTTE